jgi:hypothetical protein
MIVVGWNNGSPNNRTGAGYGIRIAHEDRDAHFQNGWPSVVIELEGENEVEVSLSTSFWRGCTELRSAQIGRWLLRQGLAPWPTSNPPHLKLEPIGDRKFRLSRL